MAEKSKDLLRQASKHFKKFDLEDAKNKSIDTVTLTTESEKPNDVIRLVIISDTHGFTKRLDTFVPSGDILIHCGDFTMYGKPKEVSKFDTFLGLLKDRFQHIVVISGNHELSFDTSLLQSSKAADDVKGLLTNCVYLEDEEINLLGLKIYGTPWHPEYREDAFSVRCGKECLEKWSLIPKEVDVLITHTPPFGFCDFAKSKHTGCAELLFIVQEKVKPKVHAFGHIHEAYGAATDGTTTYVNASTCTRNYVPSNLPFIIDIKK